MVYTPRMDKEDAQMLRRLAWGIGTFMTKTLKQVLKIIPQLVDCKEICQKCRDKSICKTCAFNRDQKNDQFHLTLVIESKKISVRPFPIVIYEKEKKPEKEKIPV